MKLNRGRYWIFAFKKESPNGGLGDLAFAFNTAEEFEEGVLSVKDKAHKHYQILDTAMNFQFEGDLGVITKWVTKNIGGEGYEET